MAHFAQLDQNNVVLQVIVLKDSDTVDSTGNESEKIGVDFCSSLFGGRWVQTSYNATFRKNYAGIGFIFDENLNAFIPPKPFESWVLNEEECQWHSPVMPPEDGMPYLWNEQSLSWIQSTKNT